MSSGESSAESDSDIEERTPAKYNVFDKFLKDDDSDSHSDSDRELQIALASGKLKPGLIQEKQKFVTQLKNNIHGLKQKLEEFKSNELPWIERLDMCNHPAPLAPELAIEIEENISSKKVNTKQDNVLQNDFTREMMFYRQAQAAVLEAVPRLQKLNVLTKRPEDYFAQMAKSDQHMQKVRSRLMKKQAGIELSEKAKKLRQLKKYGKKIQINVQQERHKEKRSLLDNISKYRKGQVDNLDFLEEEANAGSSKSKMKKELKQIKLKRQGKDKKYGYGGSKRDAKRNTSKSMSEENSLPKMSKPGAGKNKFKPKGGKPNRPGKLRRHQMKNTN